MNFEEACRKEMERMGINPDKLVGNLNIANEALKEIYGRPLRDYQKLLDAGNVAVMEKLLENEHKGGWDMIGVNRSVLRLLEEVQELMDEMKKDKINPKATRRELADVAAFAYMGILAIDEGRFGEVSEPIKCKTERLNESGSVESEG